MLQSLTLSVNYCSNFNLNDELVVDDTCINNYKNLKFSQNIHTSILYNIILFLKYFGFFCGKYLKIYIFYYS